MNIKEDYDFGLLVNESEKAVINEMDKQIPEIKMCTCETCILDIATMALNKVKPRYHVSLLGYMHTHSSDKTKFAEEIKKAVTDAIKKVKKNPAHD